MSTTKVITTKQANNFMKNHVTRDIESLEMLSNILVKELSKRKIAEGFKFKCPITDTWQKGNGTGLVVANDKNGTLVVKVAPGVAKVIKNTIIEASNKTPAKKIVTKTAKKVVAKTPAKKVVTKTAKKSNKSSKLLRKSAATASMKKKTNAPTTTTVQ